MGLRDARDATDSWAGYLYQSVLGLVVTLENILKLQDEGVHVDGHFVYEKEEDFSIFIKDVNGVIIRSSTYQAKYKQGTTPSTYYPYISSLSQAQAANTNMQYFLNISSNVVFPDNPETRTNPLPENYTSFVYQYRNGNKYLGGIECLTYLEQLIFNYRERAVLSTAPEIIERISSSLLAFIDSIIIETKELRNNNPGYRREISFLEFIDHISDNDTVLTTSLTCKILKKRFQRAFILYSETLNDEMAKKLDDVARWANECTEEEFIRLVKKIQMHRDLSLNTDLLSSFSAIEDLQEILFSVVVSVDTPFDGMDVAFKKKHSSYRPSTLRAGRNQQNNTHNLTYEYLPKIKKNMSDNDIEGFFETKKIIIDGQTIEDIWSYEITSSEVEKAENKINEPELKTLISVTDAIEELNGDD